MCLVGGMRLARAMSRGNGMFSMEREVEVQTGVGLVRIRRRLSREETGLLTNYAA